jgi:hypothetical protein
LLQGDEGQAVTVEARLVVVHERLARQHELGEPRVALEQRRDGAGHLVDHQSAHLHRVIAQARERLVHAADGVALDGVPAVAGVGRGTATPGARRRRAGRGWSHALAGLHPASFSRSVR